MADNSGQDKTEEATGKKLEDSRKKGQVAKSMEINSLAIFFSGFVLLYLFRNFVAGNIADFSKFIFGSLDILQLNLNLAKVYAWKGFLFFTVVMLPIIIGLILISFAAGYGQTGFKITPEAMEPKLSKINPIEGIKSKFFSAQAAVETIKSIFKLLVIGWLIYIILPDLMIKSVGLVDFTVGQILSFMIDTSFGFIWKISLVFSLIAMGDFAFQKHKFKKDQKMTKQEVKDEFKQTEGDPHVKSHIKGKQMEMAQKRMMQEIPKADVVITNPTHYAVALKYKMGGSSAPMVVAKGADLMAQKIKDIARENNVPIHEDVMVARALYAACEVGDEIPEKLFEAVAKILAYIYKLKNKKGRKSIV